MEAEDEEEADTEAGSGFASGMGAGTDAILCCAGWRDDSLLEGGTAEKEDSLLLLNCFLLLCSELQ